MKIILVLIYLYGVIHVGYQHDHLFVKKLRSGRFKNTKIDYVEGFCRMLFWPINWIKSAIKFHLDQPYLKD